MTDQKFHLRGGQTGALVSGTPGNVLTFQSDGTLAGETPSGGGSFAPIQRTYFLDDAFVGTSNGSIAAPFVAVSEFFAEFDAFDFGWQLNLPGGLITPDAALPDLNNNSTIVFEGIAADQSSFDLLEVDGQSGNPSFVFRQMALASLQLAFGTLDLVFEQCDVTLLQCSGTISGTVRITNCNVTHMLYGSDGPTVEMHGGSVAGQFSCSTGKFYDVQFGAFLLMTLGVGTSTFVGCSFANGGAFANTNNPIVELDPFSASSFETNVTFAGGEKRYSPSVPRVSTVRLTGGGNQVTGGGVNEFDFGNPESGIRAEPDTNCVVQFKTDPGNAALNIMGARVDAGTGHVMVLIGNNSLGTITIDDPCVLSLVFEPRFSP